MRVAGSPLFSFMGRPFYVRRNNEAIGRRRVAGNGQVKREQLEIARLKREVLKLKVNRDIL